MSKPKIEKNDEKVEEVKRLVEVMETSDIEEIASFVDSILDCRYEERENE